MVFAAVVLPGTALIFALSAVHALRDMGTQAGVVEAYRLLPPRWAPAAAWMLVLAQMAVALLLVPAATGPIGAAAGCGLLLLYAAAMAINVRRGRTDIDCGCGGAGQKISGLLVGRNVFLAGLLAAGAAWPAESAADVMGVVTVVGGAVSFAALYFAASQLMANQAGVWG